MTRSCDGPLGAASPLLAPSWFAAAPRTTTRPPRAKGVREPARRRAGRVAGHAVALELGRARGAEAVALVHHAGEPPGVGPAQRLRVDAGLLERLPGRLEELPLLRVHRERLARADPEEAGVEIARVVDEAALARI